MDRTRRGVADKVFIPRERVEQLQSDAGLSNEKLAARIPVTERTWRRWKHNAPEEERGERPAGMAAIPSSSLPAVERALGVAPATLHPRPGRTTESELDELREALKATRAQVRLLEDRLEELSRQDGPRETQESDPDP
jgi:hypothetical protein